MKSEQCPTPISELAVFVVARTVTSIAAEVTGSCVKLTAFGGLSGPTCSHRVGVHLLTAPLAGLDLSPTEWLTDGISVSNRPCCLRLSSARGSM